MNLRVLPTVVTVLHFPTHDLEILAPRLALERPSVVQATRLGLEKCEVMLGLAQVSLNWGVDDLDGTVVYYDITKREGDGTHQELTVDKLKRLIHEAGCTPVERDTLCRPVIRNESSWRVEGQNWRVEYDPQMPTTSPGQSNMMVELSIGS